MSYHLVVRLKCFLVSKFTSWIKIIPSGCTTISRSFSSQKDPLDTSFKDPIAAYKSKTTGELIRGYLVYQICAVDFLVEHNAKLMKVMQKVFGKKIFTMIMKATFYGQFVAGEDPVRIKPTVDRLASFGVKSILDYSVEEDMPSEQAEKKEVKASTPMAGEKVEAGSIKQYHVDQRFADRRKKVASARTYFYENEKSCDKNMEAFFMSIDAVHKTTQSKGFMAIKMTALGRPQLLLQLSEVIMQARKYMHEMSGGGGNVINHKKTIEDMQRFLGDHSNKPHVREFLTKITSDKQGIIHLFPWSLILDENMNLSDTFRLPDPKTGQMRRLTSQISAEEEEMFRNMLKRLNKVIQAAEKVNVRIFVDAEQTYFQPAINRITLEMQRKYNQGKFLVFNTYQTYLKDTYNEIMTDLEQAKRQNFYWAAKTVRGAYIEQERARAAAMGYEDPTCPSVEATTASYHKSLAELLRRQNEDMKGRIGVMVASHNEDTVRYALSLMEKLKIDPAGKVVCFGQLLGMCDHVTFPLGQAGYSAYKYVPYGPVVEVLPYLSRRANENRGFLAKIKKERNLLLSEIIRRIRSGQMFYKPKGNYSPV